MSEDPEQDAIDRRKRRIVAMLERLAYPAGAVAGGEPAKQIDLAVLPDIGQDVRVTSDSLDFVDYYFRPLLALDVGSKSVGVMSGTDGRWSYFRDDVGYDFLLTGGKRRRGGPTMTVRQMVGPFEDALVIVLATRPPGATMTQVSVTVMPDDEDPRRA